MSRFSSDQGGARDYSSPQVRVRDANDFRRYTSERLRLPNERPPLGPRLRRAFTAAVALAALGGVGLGVYYGVSAIINTDDEPAVTDTTEPADVGQTNPSDTAPNGQAQPAPVDQTNGQAQPDPTDSTPAVQPDQADQPADQPAAQQPAQPSIAVSEIQPTISTDIVTPAQIGGAETSAERVTAEPVPSGIPRTLADGAEYDPSEPATVLTSRWPVGVTLRLTRLPGATLLTDEQQAEVVGAQTLVVVRGTESSNTDLQLSPAAFDQIAVYGTERIIAVRVEVTAAAP